MGLEIINPGGGGTGWDFIQATQPANPTVADKTWLQNGDETDIDEHFAMAWMWDNANSSAFSWL